MDQICSDTASGASLTASPGVDDGLRRHNCFKCFSFFSWNSILSLVEKSRWKVCMVEIIMEGLFLLKIHSACNYISWYKFHQSKTYWHFFDLLNSVQTVFAIHSIYFKKCLFLSETFIWLMEELINKSYLLTWEDEWLGKTRFYYLSQQLPTWNNLLWDLKYKIKLSYWI